MHGAVQLGYPEIMSPSPSTRHDGVGGLFDLSSRWRSDIISDFRLRSEERCAAASPGPGFPQFLDTMLDALADSPPGPWIDVGGGLGGVGSWLNRRSGRPIVLVDSSPSAVVAASSLFPELDVVTGSGAALPLVDSGAGAVILSGVISLHADITSLLGEAHRVLSVGGMVTVSDLWSATDRPVIRPPNTFWSLEEVRDRCGPLGLDMHSVAACETSVGWWSAADDQVHDEMRRRHGDHPVFERYEADRRHIQAAVGTGQLIAASITFVRADIIDQEL